MSSVIPKRIQNKILSDANNDDEYTPMPNCYHITELVGCIRKTFYRKTLPRQPVDLDTAKNFFRGNHWDRAFTSLYPHNQIRVTYRCQKIPICISGHFDFINDDDPTNLVVTDLKSPKTLFFVKRENKASEHYRKQVLFYCYTTAISKGCVAYWDGNDWLEFPVEVSDEACKLLIEEIESKTLALWMAFKHGKPPSKQAFLPEVWECKYCDFREPCEQEGQSKL